MSENKKNAPEAALDDAALNDAAGGVSRRGTVRQVKCSRCEGWFPETSTTGGYCAKCLDFLHSQGVYPPI